MQILRATRGVPLKPGGTLSYLARPVRPPGQFFMRHPGARSACEPKPCRPPPRGAPEAIEISTLQANLTLWMDRRSRFSTLEYPRPSPAPSARRTGFVQETTYSTKLARRIYAVRLPSLSKKYPFLIVSIDDSSQT